MEFSKYNIFSKIKDSENYFLLNLLSGNADILEPEKANEVINNNITNIDEYIEKGYLIDPEEEGTRNRMAYLDFLDKRDESEIQIFFVPSYSCNFNCSYCYQDEYQWQNTKLSEEIIDFFFNYIDKEFIGKKKYITIFGGEPLLPGIEYKTNIEKILSKASKRDIDIAVVTNGYNLIDYVDILSKAKIREVQVTLDGTEDVHDTRRFLKNGNKTFKRIVQGIDAVLAKEIPINLRMVLDKDNIDDLPEFAAYAIAKKWTKNPFFKTQLGRNYELHHCQKNNSSLYDRVSLYEKIYKLIKDNPQILEFHKPAFSVSKFLYENGELPEPLYDSCPGCKTEWAFDYTGRIYPCTATVGKSNELVGTYYPEVNKDINLIETWEDRDVNSIKECKECSVQHLCGGGCASVAKNQNGRIHSPDCRPVKELMEMGISLYFQEEVSNDRED